MKNKIKSLAAFALTALSFTAAQAQTDSSTPQFGVKGGVNFSNIYTDDVDDNNVLTSFNAGLFATFPVGDILSIQPEILYTRKGSKVTYNNPLSSEDGEFKFKLNYIEVPVLAKVNITENLSVHAGPYFAYLVDAQVKNEAEGLDFEENYDNDDFKKFDVGIAGGIGLDFGAVGVGARYNYGFTNIFKETNGTSPDGKNSSFSLYATVKLN